MVQERLEARVFIHHSSLILSAQSGRSSRMNSCRTMDMEQIEAGLRTRVGPPASNFEELDAAEHCKSHAWYIDTFSDLRSC